MKSQRTFRLIGRTTVFTLEREYKAANFIPAVVGYTLDRKLMTVAREADIIWLNEAA